jgi:hypothetical protein
VRCAKDVVIRLGIAFSLFLLVPASAICVYSFFGYWFETNWFNLVGSGCTFISLVRSVRLILTMVHCWFTGKWMW